MGAIFSSFLVYQYKMRATHFDDVVITGDDIPDMDMNLSVEPKAKYTTTWAAIKHQ